MGKQVERATIPSWDQLIAVYYKDTKFCENSNIYYRQTTDGELLLNITRLVHSSYSKTFFPSNAIIVTFSKLCDNILPHKTFSYQATILSNDEEVYLILNYQTLRNSGAITGFSLNSDCIYELFAPVTTSEELERTSNTGIKGVHLYQLTRQYCSSSGKEFFYTLDVLPLEDY